jgi:DMSO/TMAO reductase YedYZ molybdopterin-dependent catalytic subunit
VNDVEHIQTHPPGRPRLPDGQHHTTKGPVLTYGPTPQVSTDDWRMRIWGACGAPLELDWAALTALPFVRVQADMHCVTTWSRFDFVWGGYRVRDLLALAKPATGCTHVMQHGYGGYTTNTPLEALLDPDALVVTEADGEPLETEHGGPARVVVPKLWAWKGAKWINGFELMTSDRRGFWEVNGYHNHGDPWGPGEERYSHQEQAQQTRKEGNDLRRRG